jgi:hypothetical protein
MDLRIRDGQIDAPSGPAVYQIPAGDGPTRVSLNTCFTSVSPLR